MKKVKNAIMLTFVFLLLCGFAYPLTVTAISQILFPHQANGSIVSYNGEAVGSELIGQDFTDPRLMKCRPSSVSYNTYTEEQKVNGEFGGVASGSYNYAPSNPDLIARVEADIETFLVNNPDISQEDIPADLLTASGSGLDPHISPESAQIQIPALAEATGLSQEQLMEIVNNNTDGKLLGVFGAEAVNVLKVNLEIAKQLNI